MIRNRATLERTGAHGVALDCVEAAIENASPARATREAVEVAGDQLTVAENVYDLGEYEDVLVVGGGKAAVGVARALEATLGDRLTDGLVVSDQPAELDRVRVRVGDHPVPSDRNAAATAALLDMVGDAGVDTLILVGITGGASALLVSPAEGVGVQTLGETTDALLSSGAPIAEINAVRKHLSALKGGQLARAAAPATVVGLALSDVVGNDLSVIGSGPTVPDDTTFGDALAVLDRYDLDIPASVRSRLRAGDAGEVAETPKPGATLFETVTTVCIGTNGTALDAAAASAADAGYTSLRLTSRLRGRSRHVAPVLLSVAEEIAAAGRPVEPPAVVVAGGETTVELRGPAGRGGPNQELALAAALELSGRQVLAAVDTDGSDGSSDAAGAIVDASTTSDIDDPTQRLADHDAGGALEAAEATIRTGATGTNVNDIVVVVVPEPGT